MQSQPATPPPGSSTTGRRTVSIAIALILLVVGLGVGAGATYVATHLPSTAQSTNAFCYSPFITNPSGCVSLCTSGKTITLGELLDLSSSLSNQGTRAKDSSVIAINDINSLLSSGGCNNLKFATAVDDYGLSNTNALSDLQAFAASGVQVVVGPLNSGSAQYILSYADSNHIVLISPSSTATTLAISNDYLYRTVPNDAAQGLADARMFVDRGATDAIIMYRNDAYGSGLANATRDRFVALSGHVETMIPYDASAADAGTLDWTPVLTTLNSEFNSAAGTYGAGKIAIDVISFEEFSQMIIKAHSGFASGSTYNFPWSTLPWFGTDGQADDAKVITPTSTGTLVAQVRLSSTLFATTNNTKSQALFSSFSSQYSGQTCDSYCLGAYDDIWLGAMATIQAGGYNGTAIQAWLQSYVSSYNGSFFGVTGPIAFQSSGDRVPTSYQIWKVATVSGTPTWEIAGTWSDTTDTITWTSVP